MKGAKTNSKNDKGVYSSSWTVTIVTSVARTVTLITIQVQGVNILLPGQ